MSMLVLIRNIEEMDTALEAANKYVIFMQKLFDSNQQENWILGVWVRSEFETDLPYLSCQNQKSTGTVIDESSESNVITLKKPVYIQQSVSLCGIYSFFWVNGDLIQDTEGPRERRCAIIQNLIIPYSQEKSLFFPVLQQKESIKTYQSATSNLCKQHPNLIATTGYVADRGQGIIVDESN